MHDGWTGDLQAGRGCVSEKLFSYTSFFRIAGNVLLQFKKVLMLYIFSE